MAVTRALNVVKATADADTIVGHAVITAIKVVGAGSGMTVNLKKTNTSGEIVYTSTVGVSSEKLDLVHIVSNGTLYVNVSAGSGVVYIYLK